MASTSDQIHQRALLAGKNFRRAEAEIIASLVEVESARVFKKYECKSLFEYAVKYMGLTEAVAHNAIAVDRKVRTVPALGAEIEARAIGLSVAKKILSVITPENAGEWIQKAKTLSCRKLEKEVARVNPRSATPEKATYVSEDHLELTLGVSEKLMLQIRRAQEQVSQSLGRPATLEETLEAMAKLYLKYKDPLEKAKRVIAKKGTQPITKVVHVNESGRTPIPARIKNAVRLRDQNRCQFRQRDGSKCGARRWIDFHHVQPVHEGGRNTADNLIILCRAHHQDVHNAPHFKPPQFALYSPPRGMLVPSKK